MTLMSRFLLNQIHSSTSVVRFPNEWLLWGGSKWNGNILCSLHFIVFLSWIKSIQLCQFPNEWLWMFISFQWFFLVNQTVCDQLCFVSLSVWLLTSKPQIHRNIFLIYRDGDACYCCLSTQIWKIQIYLHPLQNNFWMTAWLIWS